MRKILLLLGLGLGGAFSQTPLPSSEEAAREFGNIQAGRRVIDPPREVEEIVIPDERVIERRRSSQYRNFQYGKVAESRIFQELSKVSVQKPQLLIVEKPQPQSGVREQVQGQESIAMQGKEQKNLVNEIVEDEGFCFFDRTYTVTPVSFDVPVEVPCKLKKLGQVKVEGEFVFHRVGALLFEPRSIVKDGKRVPVEGFATNRERTSKNIASYINKAVVQKIVAASALESSEMVLEGLGERFSQAGEQIITEEGIIIRKEEPEVKDILKQAGFGFLASVFRNLGRYGLETLEANTPLFRVDKGTVFYIRVRLNALGG